MQIEFLSIAENEFKDAVSYYNRQSEGLGFEFANEVVASIDRIAHFPSAWTKLSKRVRRCRMKRFPYALLYEHKNDKIIVVAVMHLHRDPESWQNRL